MSPPSPPTPTLTQTQTHSLFLFSYTSYSKKFMPYEELVLVCTDFIRLCQFLILIHFNLPVKKDGCI